MSIIIIGCWRYKRVWCNCVQFLLAIYISLPHIFTELHSRRAQKSVYVFQSSVRYCCQIFVQNRNVLTNLIKLPNFKLYEIGFSDSQTVTRGQTDGQAHTLGLIRQFFFETRQKSMLEQMNISLFCCTIRTRNDETLSRKSTTFLSDVTLKLVLTDV